MEWLLIGFGGMLGTLSRFWLSQLIQSSYIGIALINCLGCLALGFLHPLSLNVLVKKVLSVGFLGAFTTYSTFILLSFMLAQDKLIPGILYIFLQIILGMVCLWLGYKLGLLV